MKRDKVSTFFKSKGFYVSLFTGIFAVFVLTMVYANVNSVRRQSEEELQKEQELPEQLAEVNPVGEGAIEYNARGGEMRPNAGGVSVESDTARTEPQDEVAVVPEREDSSVQEQENAMEEQLELAEVAELESEYGQMDSERNENESAAAPVSAVTEQQNALQNLRFEEESGLLWPAEGPIIKHYSMDKLVFFETLDQFKCNPAVLIGCEVGQEVQCGAKGVITAITKTDELGECVLVDIGNGYQLRYGQLSELQVQVGDMVEEGDVLAKVAEPTIYYNEEGCNLYFQVLQDGETVNPLLLLR